MFMHHAIQGNPTRAMSTAPASGTIRNACSERTPNLEVECIHIGQRVGGRAHAVADEAGNHGCGVVVLAQHAEDNHRGEENDEDQLHGKNDGQRVVLC
ncbi:hypothetical protein OIU93_20325 [Paeniglutamicibacter sp. ZC-3]|nr:hypothetical protein [Paeniglutamicibacter sp. ZC-3]MCV9996601.1 hypothetical protein [Paeniglutamicibacter sp. ZC-3]